MACGISTLIFNLQAKNQLVASQLQITQYNYTETFCMDIVGLSKLKLYFILYDSFFFLNRLQRNIHDTFALLIVYKERGLVDVWYKLTDCLIENNCSVKTNETQRQNSLCAHSGYGFHQKHSLPLFLFGSESPACVCVLGLACVDSFNVVTRQVVSSQTRLDKCL